ncbi:hypothetical protein JOQ06_009405 [Pogonophryne albipinna]|uniref:C2H2-type domain-containing protein n=1 Tax=Pogonophryne albipinna TaxID=1090488 RepID=A0AAD6FVV0_9TELE|nr:hypothetical protein JOQ06_009405 [Pogonophryne albipinna]
MFKTEKLKALVNERLKAAAEEIFSIFETTIKDYEENVWRSKQEIEQQRRSLAGCKAPLQPSVQVKYAPSEQDLCERKIDQDDQEPLEIKEEQEENLRSAPAGEKQQEEADAKETTFNIVHVQSNEEDGIQFPHQNQEMDNKEDNLPGSSSCKQVKKSKAEKEDCGLSASDVNMSETSDNEWRDGGGVIMKDPQHETAERPYTCSVCNKTFSIKSILTRHTKTHTGEKPYICVVCGKSFIQRSSLQTHMNSHSGQKPHTCRFCGRGFTQVGNMNAHIRIHTGEKPHSCTDCGKSFREKADLIKHTIIHTGEKPYICTVCDMKFNAQSNLTRHMKTHSGERPFSCTACGKGFIRRSHLLIHMKTHTGENI